MNPRSTPRWDDLAHWGSSAAGKTTVSHALHDLLQEEGLRPYCLDGDDLREGLNLDLGFEEHDRAENVRRLGEVAILLASYGHLSIVSAISPYVAGRKAVRDRHESLGVIFLEIYVATPLEVCDACDPKGLYGVSSERRACVVHRDLGTL